MRSIIMVNNQKRCFWVENSSDLYKEYHDKQWGVPVYDDHELFEMLILESFQAGLSWLIILKKREAFREAFDFFDTEKILLYGEDKVQELLNNEKIIRNQVKIRAAISNARIFVDIQKEYGSFSKYIWGFTDNKIIKNMDDHIPTKTSLSDTVSKDLIKRGMKFVGSVTVYSYLQAVGIVNDHETGCFKYV